MREYPQSYMIRFARNVCYVFALARAVEVITNDKLSADKIFGQALELKCIGDDGFVKDAEEFLEAIYPGKKWKVDKSEKPGTGKGMVNIEHWKSPQGWDHFKLSDRDARYGDCEAVSKGKIVDYRIVYMK